MHIQEPIFPTERIELVWQGIDHAEGLAIDDDGTVWAGGELGQIYRGRLDGEPREIATVPGRPWGFALDGSGNAYTAVSEPHGVYRVTPEGQVDLVSSGAPGRALGWPNHPAFLPSGVLVWTDSGSWGADDGCIYAVTPDGETTVADTSACRFANGLCASPDGTTLAVVESTLPGVCGLAIGPGSQLSGRRVLVNLPGMIPDGVAYDEHGRLLVSCWAPDAVFVLELDGRLRAVVGDPTRVALHEPTNIAFLPGTRRLVAANYGERYLSVFEHDAPGARLPRPDFPWTP